MIRSALPMVIALVLVFACGLSTASAVVNGTPIPCDDRRFDAVGLFMTAYSPTSDCGGYFSGSCVLIAPNKVLLCRHQLNVDAYEPLPSKPHGFRVRFRRDTSGTAFNSFSGVGGVCHGVYQEFWVNSFVEPLYTGTDLVIGTLDGIPAGITPIGLEINTNPGAGVPIILAGWGYAGECYSTGDTGPSRTRLAIGPQASSSPPKLPHDALGPHLPPPCTSHEPASGSHQRLRHLQNRRWTVQFPHDGPLAGRPTFPRPA